MSQNVPSGLTVSIIIYEFSRIIETVNPEGTFCDTVQVPSRGGDRELISIDIIHGHLSHHPVLF